MTAFAAFLGEKVERYIELRRSLGFTFNKQAGTLRAFVRYVERSQLDAPANRTMALDFVLPFGGAANSRAVRHGVLRRFYEYLAVYDPQTETLERRAFSRSSLGRFRRRASLARLSWRRLSTHAASFRQGFLSEAS